jgi:hypothetical protein
MIVNYYTYKFGSFQFLGIPPKGEHLEGLTIDGQVFPVSNF